MKAASAEWKPAKLNELGFVGRGKSRHRPRDAAFLYGGPYPFFQTGDIKAADFHLSEYTQTYSEAGLAQSKLWKPGTLCITIAANIAESAILGIEGCFPDSVVGFVPDPDKADVRFIKYYMDTLKLRMQSVARGTTQDNLSLDKLLKFDFYIPPLAVQRHIAEILSTYDELIENNHRRIRILEEMARALYREWFVDFRFPGCERTGRVSSSIGHVPAGWEVMRLSNLAKTQYGYTESASTDPVGPKYLRGMDINKTSYIDWAQVPYCRIEPEDQAAYQLRRGDVVVIRMADPGKSAIVEEDVDAVFASYLIRVAPMSERLSPYFLFHLLDAAEYQSYVSGASTGTTRKSASAEVLTAFEFALPSKDLMSKFEACASGFRKLLSILVKQNSILRQTRDLLLPRLLVGQM